MKRLEIWAILLTSFIRHFKKDAGSCCKASWVNPTPEAHSSVNSTPSLLSNRKGYKTTKRTWLRGSGRVDEDDYSAVLGQSGAVGLGVNWTFEVSLPGGWILCAGRNYYRTEEHSLPPSLPPSFIPFLHFLPRFSAFLFLSIGNLWPRLRRGGGGGRGRGVWPRRFCYTNFVLA